MSDEIRIRPQAQGTWSKEQMRSVAPMMPPEGSAYAERRKSRGGAGGNQALSLLVRNPGLAHGFLSFNRHLLYESALDERTKELLVLRVSWLLRCDYEWAQHAIVAEQIGITDDEIEAVKVGPDAAGWNDADRHLMHAVDGLIRTGTIDDDTFAGLADRHDDAAILDLVFTVGGYATLAMGLNVARIPLDDGMEPVDRGD